MVSVDVKHHVYLQTYCRLSIIEKLFVISQFFQTSGVISYGSGCWKDVVNLCLEFATIYLCSLFCFKWAQLQLRYKRAILLFREHLFDEDKELSESEYNLDCFKAWWEDIPDQNITTEFIKDALAR